MNEETEWLRKYAEERDGESFRRLVDRYVDLVYSSARRQVGDSELARDVTQAVFMILAEKAAMLDRSRPLSAWLMRVTRYASANARRARATRARHEQKAAEMKSEDSSSTSASETEWQAMSPMLDEGMSKLREADRDALLLRFFERKSAREVGEAMGISEDAAEKRVARAVERLRDFFRRRGVVVSSGALSAGLVAHSAEAAPIGLSAGIATSTGATTLAGTVAKGTVIAMAAAKTKMVVAGAAMALMLLGGGAVVITMANAPARRQITVPVATEQPVSSDHAVVFSDGTRIELVAITDTPGKPDRWWSANGEVRQASSPVPPVIAQVSGPMHTPYQFIFRQAPTASDVSVGLVTSTAGSASRKTDRTGRRELNYMAAIPSGEETVDVVLSATNAKYETDWRYDLSDAGASTRPAGLTVDKIYQQGSQTIVELRDDLAVSGDRETTISAITAQGDRHGAVGMSRKIFGPAVYEFNVPVKSVVAIERRSRPLERRAIRNVSLRPGTRTPVTTQPAPPQIAP